MNRAALVDQYTDAIQIGVLDQERGSWLVQSAIDRSVALIESGRIALSPEVVTIAAVLMSANEGMASVTALAHAERLVALSGVGSALTNIQSGLNFLRSGAVGEQLANDSLARSAVRAVLRALVTQTSEHLTRLTA
jgi:hypothetical protein